MARPCVGRRVRFWVVLACLVLLVLVQFTSETPASRSASAYYYNYMWPNPSSLIHQKDDKPSIVKADHEVDLRTQEEDDDVEDASIDKDETGLPSCRQLMREGGSLHGSNGDFLTSPNSAFHWTMREDGSRAYDLTNRCSLHRYTAQQARVCLADKHLLFIGDSLTRFQVTSLVYLLERGVYPPRFNRRNNGVCNPYGRRPNETNLERLDTEWEQCSEYDRPNVCVADDFHHVTPTRDSWASFHHEMGGGSTTEGVGGVFRGRLECDCVRGGLVCPDHRRMCDVENFFYQSDFSNHTGKQPTAVSFFFEEGWGEHPSPIRGFNFTGCAVNGTCRFDQNVFNEKRNRAHNGSYNFYQPLGDALERESGALWDVIPPVDVSIYNRGLWGPLTTAQAQRYMPLFRDMTSQRQGGRCFYKSTTGSARTSVGSYAHEQGTVRNESARFGCSFFDLASITMDFGKMPDEIDGEANLERETIFSDTIHFRPWVYEEFNNILLNVLCN